MKLSRNWFRAGTLALTVGGLCVGGLWAANSLRREPADVKQALVKPLDANSPAANEPLAVGDFADELPRESRSVGERGRVPDFPLWSEPVGRILPCQACSPIVHGVDCAQGDGCREPNWRDWGPIDWSPNQYGEYAATSRLAPVASYRLRVNDQIDLVYRLTRQQMPSAYLLNVGDTIRLDEATDSTLFRENLIVLPDGTVTAPLLGPVRAAGRSVSELDADLEKQYKRLIKNPSVTITVTKADTRLEDLRAAIDGRSGITGGQGLRVTVTPEGTIGVPALGSIWAQGLSLEELQGELNERYVQAFFGIEVTAILHQRAPRFAFVVGEVQRPGQVSLEQPTTVLQAIAAAGSWLNGANLREVVVLRRDEDWRLMATRLDLRGALLGKRPIPSDEIWLRDSDLVIVPKSPIRVADDWIELVFTKGVYGVLPFSTSYFFSSNGFGGGSSSR